MALDLLEILSHSMHGNRTYLEASSPVSPPKKVNFTPSTSHIEVMAKGITYGVS
jgi:hypothetical protein